MKESTKRYLHLIGSGLSIIGIVFLGWRLFKYLREYDLSFLGNSIYFYIVSLAFISGTSGLILAIAWRHLLIQLGIVTTYRWAIECYGISQAGKYLPGNVFQFFGRHALGLAAGLPNKILAKSTFGEIALISLAGSTFGWFALPLVILQPSHYLILTLWLASIFSIEYMVRQLIGFHTAKAFRWLVLYLAIAGILFTAILDQVVARRSFQIDDWLFFSGSFVVSWLAGFITPGAPAGLGIREVVLLLLLKNNIEEAELTIALVLGRIYTVAGDLLFFSFVWFRQKFLTKTKVVT